MDTPRLQSRARPPQLLSKPNPPSPPPPPPISSATTSPSHDFSLPSPFGGGHLPPLSMSRTPVGRIGSDLSHLSHARASRHHHATTSSKDRDRDSSSSSSSSGAKNKASSPFFSGLAGAWRKESSSSSSSSDVTARKQQVEAEKRKKDRAKTALDVGQWVKRHMASMVEQLRASFSRYSSERETREQRRRPHSFSGHGPGAVREIRERERWRRRRGQLSSAPASLRVSPANSGHLSVGGSVKVSTSSEESTMEELQNAIEAAIAHCKNSISLRGQAADGERGRDTKLQ